MNGFWRICAWAFLALTLTACYDEREAVDPDEFTPELRSFDLIDSYNQDTARPPYGDLALNPDPDHYNGMFEIFWHVNSLEDYTVTLRVSDRPSIASSLSVHSEVCGEGRWCDQGGNLLCEYTSDFYLSCDNSNNPLDIASFFPAVPQQLYLFLEVCDSNSSYCEYDYYPVIFE